MTCKQLLAIALLVAIVIYGRRNSRYVPRTIEKGEPIAALVKDRWSR